MPPSKQMTPWEILDIDENCEYEVVRKAFRKKVLQCHPDKVKLMKGAPLMPSGDGKATNTTEEFQCVLKAFETLKKEFHAEKQTGVLQECRRLLSKGEGNVNRIGFDLTHEIDTDLRCYTCRCGYDIPIELDFVSQYEVRKL